MNVHLAKFMMYFKIHELQRDGRSVSQISSDLLINRRTIIKYLSMNEQAYEAFLIQQSERQKELLPYTSFVKERLELYQDTSAAQLHDWLKAQYVDFPKVNPKTVFNFVHWVRGKFNLPKINIYRQHHPVEELPYGQQAQVDFGEYHLRTSTHKRVKVFFFTFVLSRSRFKYVWFTDRYFTTELAIQAHEQAFAYIKGMPDEIVYDQDTLFISNENHGDIILTDSFRAYTREKEFKLHFCRKADPQSKGKVENVVKYVKQNFLYNRTYHNIETLNDDAMGWLGRTANALPHTFTQKAPFSELNIEQPFLKPYTASIPKVISVSYTIRKDNTISYKSNLYSLPLGSYQGRGSQVAVWVEQQELVILVKDAKESFRHEIAKGKGLKIFNTDHRRDKSSAIDEMIEGLCVLLENPNQGRQWMQIIRSAMPRYIRDQLMIIKQNIEGVEKSLVSKALNYCLDNKITSASDFKAILSQYKQTEPKVEVHRKIIRLNPLGDKLPNGAMSMPDKSQIEDYQTIFRNKNN